MGRPRFTIRVALAVTTLAAVLSWQGGIVWQRRVAMRDSGHTFKVALPAPGFIKPEELARVNILRQLLGDTAIQYVYVTGGRDEQEENARMTNLFSEARVEISTMVW